MVDVRQLIEALRKNSVHEMFREYGQIRQPKPDGYRCHHMVFNSVGLTKKRCSMGGGLKFRSELSFNTLGRLRSEAVDLPPRRFEIWRREPGLATTFRFDVRRVCGSGKLQ